MTTTETTVQNLKINTLTQQQYSGITPSATELYMVTDDIPLSQSDVDSALSPTSEKPVQNKVIYNALNNKADDSAVVKLDSGSGSQTIQLTSGSGTTPLVLRSKATTCYLSFNANGTWKGSYGVDANKKPTFYNGTGYTLAYTSDIPTIATSVSSSSTNDETVGAKLFYDTVGDIETLLSQV